MAARGYETVRGECNSAQPAPSGVGVLFACFRIPTLGISIANNNTNDNDNENDDNNNNNSNNTTTINDLTERGMIRWKPSSSSNVSIRYFWSSFT